MATTSTGATLTNAQRLAQVQLRTTMTRQLLDLWPALNPENVDDTFTAWSSAAGKLIETRYADSSAIAGAYYRTFRAVEIGTGIAPVLAGPLPDRQLAVTLLVSGPVAIKKLTAAGMSPAQAADQAFVMHSGAATRLALTGGRETILNSVRADRRGAGWARITSGNGCDFCQMLAGRDAVYRSEDTASFEAHNHCACTAEPTFS